MNRFPALAALAFALSTLCACDPSQMLPQQGKVQASSHQGKVQASPHQGQVQAQSHKAKPASQDYAPHIGDTCSIWPGNGTLCSPVPDPNPGDVGPAGQD